MSSFSVSKLLTKICTLTVRHPFKVAISGMILAAISVYLTANLRIKPNWIDLIPQYDPSVKKFNEIVSNFGSFTPIVISIESSNTARLPAYADELCTVLRSFP